MDSNPGLRVLAHCGYHDLFCHYYENVWTLSSLPAELRARIVVRTYEGGHETYLNKSSRLAMQRDLTSFIEEVTRVGR